MQKFGEKRSKIMSLPKIEVYCITMHSHFALGHNGQAGTPTPASPLDGLKKA